MSRTGPGSILGHRVVRVEDPELLLGRGQFVDDIDIDGVLHLAFVRSPIAHGYVRSVDTTAVEAMPGVVAVFSAANLGVAPQHNFIVINEACARPPLADGKVRFVGDAVAAVVAETLEQAIDATEVVVVDYEPLPAVIDMEAALEDGAPLQFESIGSNLAAGFRDERERNALAGAEVVVRGRFENQRIGVVPMEGNAIAVVPTHATDGGPDGVTVYLSTQAPHRLKGLLAKAAGLSPEAVRVVAPHVGGAFGSKGGIMAEHITAVAVALHLDRPVKWVETRSENLLAGHGRGQVQYIEVGFTLDGTIVGAHCRVVGDAGAYGGFGGRLAMGPTRNMAQGVYRIPALTYDVAVALTNTTPMGAFRGAGRPEAACYLERIMDMAADQLGIDVVELRRRNFIRPDDFPFQTVMGPLYDSGTYAAALSKALEVAGYDELRREQAERRARGDRLQLGIGVAVYVEITAGVENPEFGAVTVHDDGSVTASAGTSSHGQGHATTFAMIVSERLGIPMERVRFVQSDTALVPRGNGTGGSRSLQIGGSAVLAASELVVDRARRLAATLLEANEDDIVVADGRVGVAGVPSLALTWAQLAEAAAAEGDPLGAEFDFIQKGGTFPFGAHVSVVEVDVETGHVRPVRHVAVDDCGRIVNPMIVTGQQHGGIAQGIAQALWEQFVYDDHGNPITSTLADYAMPSAADLPGFEATTTETTTPRNPLGAKGIGESGTVGSTPAVQNAVIDAVKHLGVVHIDMPCTPERVWRAVRDAAAGTLPPVWREPPAVFESLPLRGE